MVSVVLPNGRRVTGVTMWAMIEGFQPKPKKAQAPRPAPAHKEAATPAKPEAVTAAEAQPEAAAAEPGGDTPPPPLKNSPGTFCKDKPPCSDEEFSARLAALKKRWVSMPDWLQRSCEASTTLTGVEECVASQTSAWASANPGKATPWMLPAGKQ